MLTLTIGTFVNPSYMSDRTDQANAIFTDLDSITKKIGYLNSYRKQHQMDNADYVAEELTPERENQHNQEWQRYVSLID